MQKRQEYIWCLIELSNGNKEWYCLSKVLRRALFIEKKHNQFWKKTMIGNYITVARSKYIRGRARLTVGRIEKIRIRKIVQQTGIGAEINLLQQSTYWILKIHLII